MRRSFSSSTRASLCNAHTDLYFPIGDAEYERQFIPRVQFVPIPSIWGHVADAGGSPDDNAFLNAEIGKALLEDGR